MGLEPVITGFNFPSKRLSDGGVKTFFRWLRCVLPLSPSQQFIVQLPTLILLLLLQTGLTTSTGGNTPSTDKCLIQTYFKNTEYSFRNYFNCNNCESQRHLSDLVFVRRINLHQQEEEKRNMQLSYFTLTLNYVTISKLQSNYLPCGSPNYQEYVKMHIPLSPIQHLKKLFFVRPKKKSYKPKWVLETVNSYLPCSCKKEMCACCFPVKYYDEQRWVGLFLNSKSNVSEFFRTPTWWETQGWAEKDLSETPALCNAKPWHRHDTWQLSHQAAQCHYHLWGAEGPGEENKQCEKRSSLLNIVNETWKNLHLLCQPMHLNFAPLKQLIILLSLTSCGVRFGHHSAVIRHNHYLLLPLKAALQTTDVIFWTACLVVQILQTLFSHC